MERESIVTTNVRIPSALYAQVKDLAKLEDRSLNSLIVHLLRQAVEQRLPPPAPPTAPR